MTQPLQGVHLDLAHPLAGDTELRRDLLQRGVLVAVQAETALDHLALLVVELGEPAFAAQCIPVEASLLEVESYKAFLLERRKRIATALNTFVGPAD